MESCHWTSYIKRVIEKTEENNILRKFIKNALNNKQESPVYYKRNPDSPNDKTESKHSISSITTNSDCSTKRVTLNLSENQIYESRDYLTPIANPRIRLATKTYNLPEIKKPEIVDVKKLNNAVQYENNIFHKNIELSKNNTSNLSIIDSECCLNEIKSNDKTFDVYSSIESVNQEKTPIKSILKSSKQSINETSLNTTSSPTNRSISDKFIVNLYESRASKRWTRDVNSSFIEATPKTDLSHNEENSLLNVVSTTIIYDMIKDIEHSIHNNLDDALFRKTFGSIERVDECIEGDVYLTLDEIFLKYKRETEIQCQIMIETTKILRKCRKIKNFYGSNVHIEAERILLLSSLKHNRITEKILQNQYEYLDKNKIATGILLLNSIQFPLDASNYKMPNWYVCVLTCADKILISKIVKPKNNYIEIDEEYVFDKLDWNFEVSVSLYCMALPKYRKYKTRFFKKKEKRYLLKTLRYKDLKTNTITESYITNSSFQLCANAKIRLNEIKDQQILRLNQKTPWLNDNLFLNVQLKEVDFQVKWSGFLTIGKDRIGYIVWNRRWCVLRGYEMKFYNYPTDEDFSQPIECLNLKNVLYPYLIAANRNTCPRPRTVLLHIGLSRKRFQYYISADTNEELKEFKSITEEVIMYLKNWKLQTYSNESQN